MKETAWCCAVHTHSACCDGADTLADMAEAAFSLGVRYFGASGHSHTSIPYDEGNVLPLGAAAYRAEVLRLREVYAGRMEVLCGLEWDSQSDEPFAGWDYWIGSVHNLCAAGAHWAVDWDRERLAACRDEAFGGDMYALAAAYYAEVARVAALKPTILGHVDLICKLNDGGELFDEGDPRYRAAALEALHAADPAATLLEINTGALARGYRSAPYPAPFLLEAWRRMGGQVIVTGDTHRREHMLWGYGMAVEAARAAGFRETCLLTTEGVRAAAL